MISLLLLITACGGDSENASDNKDENNNNQVENNEVVEDNENNLNAGESDKNGFPIVDEEINLKFFAGKSPSTHSNWNESMLYDEYEKMTNMNIEFEMVPFESRDEKRNLALAGGNLPDVFQNVAMPATDLLKYGEQDILLPLNDLIDEYAPNFKALMDEYPEIKEGVTMSDGNIYGFPNVTDPEFLSMRMGPKPFVHKEWLDELDMDVPETTEDYYEFLKAVKEGDPSNGEVEEIPFGAPYMYPLYQYLQGSFGVANKGSAVGLLDEDPESGDYRFYPTSDQYKELLEYMNKLFSEELIEQNLYSIEHNQYIANANEGRYASIIWYSPNEILGEELGSKYANLPALEGPHGDKSWVTLIDPVIDPGAFVLTSANEYPEETVQWIDYFYGQEGMEMFFMGFEDVTFEYDENGDAVYMDHILNSENDLSYEQELAEYLTFPGGGFPSLITLDYFQGAESQPDEMAGADLLEPDLIEDPWSTSQHTEEENKALQGVGTDIEKYVEEMRDKFIVGSESFDEWDKYVETLEGMRLDEYMEIKVDAIERQEN